jgi:hypothetical protein
MKPAEPIAEEMLDKMLSVLEGPVNKLAERALSSNIVLAPLSLSMNVTLRFWRAILGTGANATGKKGGGK